MTYSRFEELPVWQEAIRLANGIYDFTEKHKKVLSQSLWDQIERAALSVSNNVAEGFKRGTTNELLMFIYIARGSAGEVRSMICFIEHRQGFTNLKSTAESCSRQLRAWADHLQNSDIKGQRHLNEKTRQQYETGKKAEDFQQEFLSCLLAGHPLRKRKQHRYEDTKSVLVEKDDFPEGVNK